MVSAVKLAEINEMIKNGTLPSSFFDSVAAHRQCNEMFPGKGVPKEFQRHYPLNSMGISYEEMEAARNTAQRIMQQNRTQRLTRCYGDPNADPNSPEYKEAQREMKRMTNNLLAQMATKPSPAAASIVSDKISQETGLPLTGNVPDYIEFVWNPTMLDKFQCDTLHALYLLQSALEKLRVRTIERNKHFRSIRRFDRIITMKDGFQILRNFLDWHTRDPIHHQFDGHMLWKAKTEKLWMINDVISEIGIVKKGPSTIIYSRLLKEVYVDLRNWCRSPQPVLKLKFWGWSRDEVLKVARGYRRFKMEMEYNILMPIGLDPFISQYLSTGFYFEAFFRKITGMENDGERNKPFEF